MYKKLVLKNGLTLILADMPAMESLSVGVWIGAGGRYETKEKAGISHFLEHMIFKGTKKLSAQKLKESIEGIGGSLNGFTGEEFTCYLVKVLSADAKIALDVLSDMALNPKLADEDFQKERFVILEEIKMYMDMPNHHVQEILVELLWPNQPLGLPLAGTPKSVSGLTRGDLAAYKENFYNPGNIIVSVAGKLPSFDLVKVIEKSFGAAKEGPKQIFAPVEISQKEPATNFYFKKTEQTHVALGIHGYSRFCANKYALDLLHIILGGNMSSRLFNEVREKQGLAYEISSSVKHYHDTGALVISAGIDNKKVKKAIHVILKELGKIRASKVTKEEFARAKEFYRGQLLMMYEETMNHMLWLGEKYITGDMEFKAKDIQNRIDSVGIDDIKKAAEDVIKSGNLNLAVVGPTDKKDIKEITQRLGEL